MELAWSNWGTGRIPMLQEEGRDRAPAPGASSPMWDVKSLLCSRVFLTL